MKRKLTITRNQLPYIIDKKLRLCSEREITPEFISECESDFKENPSNIITKNNNDYKNYLIYMVLFGLNILNTY